MLSRCHQFSYGPLQVITDKFSSERRDPLFQSMHFAAVASFIPSLGGHLATVEAENGFASVAGVIHGVDADSFVDQNSAVGALLGVHLRRELLLHEHLPIVALPLGPERTIAFVELWPSRCMTKQACQVCTFRAYISSPLRLHVSEDGRTVQG